MKTNNVERRNIEIFRFRLVYRILIAVMATGMVAFGVYFLAEHLLFQDYVRAIFIVDLPLLMFGVALLWGLARFRIECDDRGLLRREYRTRVIRFDMVKRLHFDPYGTFNVHSNDEVIKLTREIGRRDYLSRLIIQKVRDNPGLEITGESRWFEAYQGSKRDSKET